MWSTIASHWGLYPRCRGNIDHNFVDKNHGVWGDYLTLDFIFPIDKFQKKFRMHKELFAKIHDVMVHHDSYFEQKVNGPRKQGLYSI